MEHDPIRLDAGAPKKKRGPVEKLWHGLVKACSRSKKQQAQTHHQAPEGAQMGDATAQAPPTGEFAIWPMLHDVPAGPASSAAASSRVTPPLSTTVPPDGCPGPQSWDPHVRNGWLKWQEEQREAG